jgi:ParB-like chromosome segregation protein Spo0J/DNA modification methylase
MTATAEQMKDFRLDSIPLIEIDVGLRQRKDYGDLEGLAATIKENGLIGPIAVREKSTPGLEQKYDLVAGGRRFAACMLAGYSPVPVRIYPPEMDDHQLVVVENLENVYRKDFTVEELLASAQAIHNAQIAIHGERGHAQRGGDGWTQAMTAEMLNMATGKVSELLTLAAKAEKHPEIRAAKTITEAKKISKTIDANKAKSAKARQHEAAAKAANPAAVKLALIDAYRLEDCVTGMKKLTAGTFHCIEVDPPYAIDYKAIKAKGKTGGTTTLDYNEIEEDDYLPFMQSVLTETYRLATDDAWLILWHANNWSTKLYRILREIGWELRLLPAIWSKPDTPGQTMQPHRFLGRNYEQFFYAHKGSPLLHKQGRSDVFSFKGIPSQLRAHPTERPIELAQEVLTTFAAPGANVLVPFAGSGNTILAANNLHMNAIGFDLAEQYKDTFIVKVYEGEPGQFSSYKRKEVKA